MFSRADITVIRQSMFFRGIDGEDLDAALSALRASVRTFDRGELILHAGDTTARMGLVLAGSVTVESNDVWGARSILSHAGPGEFFAETYAMLPDEVLLVDVSANEDCRILFLTMRALDEKGPEPWRARLIRNLLNISLQKNLILSNRSFHTAPHSARARIMSYLNTMALRQGSDSFEIPFDRQQMADYLNLERTALSKELGRMQREGLITFKKNRFALRGER
ncbi:MAG: Crp/Fnr family transcriptional regulator [Lachnospiraceae bacterium]|nr:Crp/Fnr family transcriptional regulator [Lachnospiraceae bacterium]